MSGTGSFPDEVFEYIFSHLPGKSLLELTLVSPRFDEIISTSRRLMKNLKFIWTGEETCTRNISAVLLFGLDEMTSATKCFINEHRYNLKTIDLEGCTFSQSEFHELLRTVAGNLEELSTHYVDVTGWEELPKINLDKLRRYNAGAIPQNCFVFLHTILKFKNLKHFAVGGSRIYPGLALRPVEIAAYLESMENLSSAGMKKLQEKVCLNPDIRDEPMRFLFGQYYYFYPIFFRSK